MKSLMQKKNAEAYQVSVDYNCGVYMKLSKETLEIFKRLELDDVIYDKLFIATSKEENKKKYFENHWIISLSESMRIITFEEWKWFFQNVINQRKKQISKSLYKPEMVFYMWYDDMPSMIKFNVVNKKLIDGPLFKCKVNYLSLDEYIKLIMDVLSNDNVNDGKIDISCFTEITSKEESEKYDEYEDYIEEQERKNYVANMYVKFF